ncbi:MAG: endonuclease III [Chthoniobacterales bacterium]|nr:endonuclease III [Chthoniobacterales bacterium]MCX7712586.1 endonuclease III [Chthoniobacterales bacterium]
MSTIKESSKSKINRASLVLETLRYLYPNAKCALTFRTPWELLVATVLSAQCTDKRVNEVTPTLFQRLPTIESFATVSQQELESLIRPTGFFRNKAKNLRACAEAILKNFAGQVPRTIKDLTSLPGVGRKTANVILGNAFGINEGMVVDTHIARLSNRLGFTSHSHPEKIERDLMLIFPPHTWTDLSHLLISHGRAICSARKPRCNLCQLAHLCPYPQKNTK